MIQKSGVPAPDQVSATYEKPLLGSHLSLPRPGLMYRRSTWILGLLAVLLGFFVISKLPHGNRNDTNQALDTEKVIPGNLIADEINLGNETIRMLHSPLDIGESKNVFDGNIETLMRGR